MSSKHLEKRLRNYFKAIGIKDETISVPSNAQVANSPKILVNPLRSVMKEVLSKSLKEQLAILSELQSKLDTRAKDNAELENG